MKHAHSFFPLLYDRIIDPDWIRITHPAMSFMIGALHMGRQFDSISRSKEYLAVNISMA